jgi:hypothetical protein
MGPSNPTGVNQVAISAKLQGQRKARQAQAESMQLPMQLRVRAPGLRSGIKTVQEAIKFIENMPTELASLQRWTFARALLGEAIITLTQHRSRCMVLIKTIGAGNDERVAKQGLS